ncbi:hypothetical protein J2W49_003490 [Hydrogenophaga palleronii]|uniref:Uncharacterized protein n=1 Tax=Hydrogenophaga palleronii TaxID=65655 RepID=A0ABU1WQP3_9BURK|nr:hypothetical protein [Hydrogenophaga palleronii]MDR7151514.1 hypothetical protein [Hydrogenophaga palleronii]
MFRAIQGIQTQTYQLSDLAMIILVLTLSIALTVFLVAVASISPIIWLLCLVSGVALGIAIAKYKSRQSSTARTLGIIAVSCIAVTGLVAFVQTFRFIEMEITGPVRDANFSQQSFDQLLVSDDPEKFSKALIVAQSPQAINRRQSMLLSLYYAIDKVDGASPLSETEIATALTVARLANFCSDFVPTVLVRQIHPADLVQTLQTIPDHSGCIGLDQKLVQLVMDRCKGPWLGRCANELPLDSLLLESVKRYEPDPRYPNRRVGERTAAAAAIRELIRTTWPLQKLNN